MRRIIYVGSLVLCLVLATYAHHIYGGPRVVELSLEPAPIDVSAIIKAKNVTADPLTPEFVDVLYNFIVHNTTLGLRYVVLSCEDPNTWEPIVVNGTFYPLIVYPTLVVDFRLEGHTADTLVAFVTAPYDIRTEYTENDTAIVLEYDLYFNFSEVPVGLQAGETAADHPLVIDRVFAFSKGAFANGTDTLTCSVVVSEYEPGIELPAGTSIFEVKMRFIVAKNPPLTRNLAVLITDYLLGRNAFLAEEEFQNLTALDGANVSLDWLDETGLYPDSGIAVQSMVLANVSSVYLGPYEPADTGVETLTFSHSGNYTLIRATLAQYEDATTTGLVYLWRLKNGKLLPILSYTFPSPLSLHAGSRVLLTAYLQINTT